MDIKSYSAFEGGGFSKFKEEAKNLASQLAEIEKFLEESKEIAQKTEMALEKLKERMAKENKQDLEGLKVIVRQMEDQRGRMQQQIAEAEKKRESLPPLLKNLQLEDVAATEILLKMKPPKKESDQRPS